MIKVASLAVQLVVFLTALWLLATHSAPDDELPSWTLKPAQAPLAWPQTPSS